MLDRVPVGVEQGRVPVAQGLVAFHSQDGQADVAARDVEAAVAAEQDDERGFESDAVVGLPVLRELHHHRVVEQGAVALGDLLELLATNCQARYPVF